MITLARRNRNRLFNQIDPPVVVLIYHRVTTLPSDPQLLAVTSDNFRAQMQYLKESFPVVRFEEDWSRVREPAVAITFDDGYADNALSALPIIEEVGVPATFFVTTGHVGGEGEFWWDELERLVLLPPRPLPAVFCLRLGLGAAAERLPTATPEDRAVLYQQLHARLKGVNAEERERWLHRIRRWAGADGKGRETHRPLTLEELDLLAKSPWVTIGAHTVTHPALAVLNGKQQEAEIVGSKQTLESWLGRKIQVFSYPFGGKGDYDRRSVEICRAAGFRKAVANFSGQARRWSDPFQLPRQLVRNWAREEFSRKIQEFWCR
jgi:peptidoglycan/xylan/chitin deacetylase (PgdA/CDA1 family)